MAKDQTETDSPIPSMPTFNISNEAWREYDYGNGKRLRVTGAKTLILDKRADGDRHRLIVADASNKDIGMYITPGWLAIRWQTPDGKHGITF